MTATTISKTTATVTAAFIPGAKSLVQMTERSTIARAKEDIKNQIKEPHSCRFAQSAILSWLNAMRMKGMETAPEMLTVYDISDESP